MASHEIPVCGIICPSVKEGLRKSGGRGVIYEICLVAFHAASLKNTVALSARGTSWLSSFSLLLSWSGLLVGSKRRIMRFILYLYIYPFISLLSSPPLPLLLAHISLPLYLSLYSLFLFSFSFHLAARRKVASPLVAWCLEVNK